VWRVALWARLQNPEQAYANLKILITKRTLPDMFDLCRPFKLTATWEVRRAITEMLIQSSTDKITLLPALPERWPTGSLKGVRVRGGVKVDIAWKDGRLTSCNLQSQHAATYRLTYGEHSVNV
jgi:alpha-L-fucosidase 2